MKKNSKRFRQALEVADREKAYSLEEAVALLGKMPPVNFDETVELNLDLAVDPKQSDQMVRGTVKLPNGSGKKVTVLVFTENPQEALDAGADYAGLADMIEKVQGGWLDFDVAIATPSAMKDVRTVARVLGPRGLMPNPKSGTVSEDIKNAIEEVKAGRVEYKMDKTANLAVVVGKISFDSAKLKENAEAALKAIIDNRPEAVKGQFINRVSIAATMSPGLKIEKTAYSVRN